MILIGPEVMNKVTLMWIFYSRNECIIQVVALVFVEMQVVVIDAYGRTAHQCPVLVEANLKLLK
jgi:hypothetical protein